MAEMLDKLAVIANKTKETLDFTKILHRSTPIAYSIHFRLINCNGAIGNDMTKIFDMGGAKSHFLSLQYHLLS